MKILRLGLLFFVIAPTPSPSSAGEARSPFIGMGKNRRSRQEGRQPGRGDPRQRRAAQSDRRNFSQALSRHRARTHQRARTVQCQQDRRRTRRRRALFRFLDQRHRDAVQPALSQHPGADGAAAYSTRGQGSQTLVSAAISGSTTQNDLFMPFRSTSRKISGTTRRS